MHASSQSLKDSKTSEPSRCSSIAVTSLSGLSGNSMLQLRRHQELSPNPYEAPSCQETNYPCERFFSFFPAFGFLALSADGVVS